VSRHPDIDALLRMLYRYRHALLRRRTITEGADRVLSEVTLLIDLFENIEGQPGKNTVWESKHWKCLQWRLDRILAVAVDK
jgi:hypothetical protein